MLLRISLFAGLIIPGVELNNGQVWWALVTFLLLVVAIVMTKIKGGSDGLGE